jgi:pyridoxamine 5'-phosphate oxidase
VSGPADRAPFQYALLRVVPHVERGESINAGVVVLCRPRRFLAARVALDEGRLEALAPGTDPGPIRERLEMLCRIAAGEQDAGPIAQLELSERFGWIVAPSSTVIQPGPVHTGLCDEPQALLDRLFAQLVALPDLHGMRRSYTRDELSKSSLAPTWLEQFERWFAEADSAIGRERNAMVVATSGPGARTVLLKQVDDRGFVFFTNLHSAKGRELAADPRAALVFPWYELERQVLVRGTTELLGEHDNDAYFHARPRGSQLSAAVSPQSEVIGSRAGLEQARARLDAEAGELVPRPPHWGGVRVVPESVEFWQGRPDRLHDRLRYRRDGDVWVVERLAP